jgi:NAD(P)-dependent dehydrogenase (short-subunit alcohol dehydrogenase family)
MMAPHLTILTGASRGMGLGLAQQLLQQPRQYLVCISRNTNAVLQALAPATGSNLEQWAHDLAQAGAAALALTSWLQAQPSGRFASATLINNAALLPRIAPLDQSAPADLAQALRVGLEAPMLLTAAFLHATTGWAVPRKVLNISSGLGRRPMASQAAYCAVKAGMDHFTRCLALEEALKPNGAKVCSLAPGVIDTDMQVTLRSADVSVFPDQGRFAGLKAQGQLTSPADAAASVLAWLDRADFGAEAVADVRG